MPTDAPSNLPPVLRPDAPPVHSLDDLAARFGVGVRGDTAGVTLTGLTLATADLRPGDVFVAVRGVNRHGAEFAAAAAEKGAVAVVTDAAGADLAAASGLPVVDRRRPARPPRRPVGVGLRHRARRPPADPVRARPAPTARPASRTCSRASSASSESSTGLSSTAERHIAGQVIVSRLTTPEAYEMHALLALMRERGRRGGRRRGERAGAQPPPRRRARLRRRRLHQPHPRPPRRLRRHARVLRGEAAAVPRRPLAPRRRVPRLRRGRRGRRAQRGADGHRSARPAIAADPDAAAAADWVVEILDERQDGTEFRLASPRRTVAHDRGPGHRTPHGRATPGSRSS